MSMMKLTVAAATLSLLVGSAIAATNVTGSWKGKIIFHTDKLPKAPNAQTQALMDKQIAMAKAMAITLNFAKNGTFTETTVTPGKPKKQESGTWSLKGNLLTVSSKDKTKPSQNLTLAKDGKTLSFDAPTGVVSIVFSR